MNLELELTELKESLKKALSGGVTLGLTIEPKAGSSGLQVAKRSYLLLHYNVTPPHSHANVFLPFVFV